MSQAATQSMSRSDRRRERTRARLVQAAQRVIARKGIDAATIAEITEQADIGLGTFYHHFESKEDILEPVMEAAAEALGDALDAATAPMADPAEVMAASIRNVVRRMDQDPLLAQFFVRMGHAVPPSARGLMRRQRRDLIQGIEAGRYHVADPAVAQACLVGSVLAVLQGKLQGLLGDDAAELLAAQALQMLGVPAQEAQEISQRPLPALSKHSALES